MKYCMRLANFKNSRDDETKKTKLLYYKENLAFHISLRLL